MMPSEFPPVVFPVLASILGFRPQLGGASPLVSAANMETSAGVDISLKRGGWRSFSLEDQRRSFPFKWLNGWQNVLADAAASRGSGHRTGVLVIFKFRRGASAESTPVNKAKPCL